MLVLIVVCSKKIFLSIPNMKNSPVVVDLLAQKAQMLCSSEYLPLQKDFRKYLGFLDAMNFVLYIYTVHVIEIAELCVFFLSQCHKLLQ